jgi:hypothetical protein
MQSTASASSVFNTLAGDAFWLLILGAIVFFGFIWFLHRLERMRDERNLARDRHRPTSSEVKDKIRRGELGPGGFPVKKRGKKK